MQQIFKHSLMENTLKKETAFTSAHPSGSCNIIHAYFFAVMDLNKRKHPFKTTIFPVRGDCGVSVGGDGVIKEQGP